MYMKLAAGFAAVVLATGVHAATETFDFTGSYAGTYSSSLDFDSDLLNTVTVSMGTFDDPIGDGSAGGGVVGQWTDWGLGVCTESYYGGCSESHYVDGSGLNEYLKFSFDYDVVIESISFLNYGNGYYDLSDGDLNVIGLDLALGADVSGTSVGSSFFVGAYEGAGFKVQSITVSSVSEVPLPAAGFLLLGGLGGLASVKRRRKS